MLPCYAIYFKDTLKMKRRLAKGKVRKGEKGNSCTQNLQYAQMLNENNEDEDDDDSIKVYELDKVKESRKEEKEFLSLKPIAFS